MRHALRPSVTLAAIALVAASASVAQAQEASHAVAGGGVTAAGWKGVVDAREASRGATIDNAKFVAEGNGFHVTTGPASAFWNPANVARGDYTVKATFTEPKYMGLNDHPHPYGVFIAGNNMGTDKQSYLYCAAYGNGNFIVRGFGPQSFQLNGGHGEANAAVHKASGPGAPVTQEIALGVKGDQVTCTINGTVVATYKKSELVGDGKLASTDGVYGVRFAHNTEGTVTGLTLIPGAKK
jgi:hypothetical protein